MSGVEDLSQVAELPFLVEHLVRVAECLSVSPVLRLDLEALAQLLNEAQELLARVLALKRVQIKFLVISLHNLHGTYSCLLQISEVRRHLELLNVLHWTQGCRPGSEPGVVDVHVS